MKRSIAIIIALLLFSATYSQVDLFLGIRSGAGEMLSRQQLNNLPTRDGISNIANDRSGWSIPFKAEALLGLGSFRIGYQFMYNYASPSITAQNFNPVITDGQYSTYFNASKMHLFAHYLLMELALINSRHFALTPGIAVGSYTGYRVDNTTGEHIMLSQVTDRHFSIGAELNAELTFGRLTILFGPNYYLFSLRDKANTSWREYQHFIGGDIGIRVNLFKK